jgi:hypothetical protein
MLWHSQGEIPILLVYPPTFQAEIPLHLPPRCPFDDALPVPHDIGVSMLPPNISREECSRSSGTQIPAMETT